MITASRKTKERDKESKGQSKSALGTTLWGPDNDHDRGSSTDRSEEAHPLTTLRKNSNEARTRLDIKATQRQAQDKATKPKVSKEKSSALTQMHCGKANYGHPQGMMPYGEDVEVGSDT